MEKGPCAAKAKSLGDRDAVRHPLWQVNSRWLRHMLEVHHTLASGSSLSLPFLICKMKRVTCCLPSRASQRGCQKDDAGKALRTESGAPGDG